MNNPLGIASAVWVSKINPFFNIGEIFGLATVSNDFNTDYSMNCVLQEKLEKYYNCPKKYSRKILRIKLKSLHWSHIFANRGCSLNSRPPCIKKSFAFLYEHLHNNTAFNLMSTEMKTKDVCIVAAKANKRHISNIPEDHFSDSSFIEKLTVTVPWALLTVRRKTLFMSFSQDKKTKFIEQIVKIDCGMLHYLNQADMTQQMLTNILEKCQELNTVKESLVTNQQTLHSVCELTSTTLSVILDRDQKLKKVKSEKGNLTWAAQRLPVWVWNDENVEHAFNIDKNFYKCFPRHYKMDIDTIETIIQDEEFQGIKLHLPWNTPQISTDVLIHYFKKIGDIQLWRLNDDEWMKNYELAMMVCGHKWGANRIVDAIPHWGGLVEFAKLAATHRSGFINRLPVLHNGHDVFLKELILNNPGIIRYKVLRRFCQDNDFFKECLLKDPRLLRFRRDFQMDRDFAIRLIEVDFGVYPLLRDDLRNDRQLIYIAICAQKPDKPCWFLDEGLPQQAKDTHFCDEEWVLYLANCNITTFKHASITIKLNNPDTMEEYILDCHCSKIDIPEEFQNDHEFAMGILRLSSHKYPLFSTEVRSTLAAIRGYKRYLYARYAAIPEAAREKFNLNPANFY